MASQLTLIDVDETSWGLDEHIKLVGRKGIAQAREALLSSQHDPAVTAGRADRGRTAA